MHALIEPVQISGLSGSGTVSALHVLTVAESKGKDYGHANVGYALKSAEGEVLASGVLAMAQDDYAAGKAADGAVTAWVAGKLGFVVTESVSDPAPERTVDEQQDPSQPEG